jgi:hypothetical protein
MKVGWHYFNIWSTGPQSARFDFQGQLRPVTEHIAAPAPTTLAVGRAA